MLPDRLNYLTVKYPMKTIKYTKMTKSCVLEQYLRQTGTQVRRYRGRVQDQMGQSHSTMAMVERSEKQIRPLVLHKETYRIISRI